MSNLAKNKAASGLCETVSNNLRLIDSLSWLVVCGIGESGDDDIITDAMIVIGKLKAEATTANDELLSIINGGSHD